MTINPTAGLEFAGGEGGAVELSLAANEIEHVILVEDAEFPLGRLVLCTNPTNANLPTGKVSGGGGLALSLIDVCLKSGCHDPNFNKTYPNRAMVN